jgi:hypothetical protein
MSIEVVPTRAALGAEIRGVDLAHPLDDATFTAIENAYNPGLRFAASAIDASHDYGREVPV